MRKTLLLSALVVTVLYGCVNSDYDLSDIDTTSRISVNNLTVPIQIDAITLDDMLDLNDDDQIKKTADGYVFREDGTFSSDAITVNKFVANGIGKEVSQSFNINYASPSKHRASGTTVIASAEIPHEKTTLDYSAANVDASIVSIDYIGLSATLTLNVRFDKLNTMLKHIHVKDLQIQFLKGLDMTLNIGTYDKNTGIITVDELQTDDNHHFTFTLTVKGIDTNLAGITLKDGNFSLHAEPAVLSGRLVGYAEDLQDGLTMLALASAPESADFYLEAKSSDIEVTEFSGDIKYNIDGFNIDPISLSNLPDILSQTGTSIELSNPELKLSVNNPLVQAGYSVYAQMGLAFASNGNTYSIAQDAVKIDEANNTFVISPSADIKNKPAGQYEWVQFADMGKILSGDQIPNTISVNVLNPCVPVQHISGFRLGQTLNRVEGNWEFYAPLALTETSKIKYVKEWDDWQDDDLDGLTVNSATITADIDSEVALDLSVDVTLLGRNGQLVGTATVPCGQNSFTTTLSGSSVSKIYGAKIEARANGTGKTLAPNQTITVSNLKATMTGYYDKEF